MQHVDAGPTVEKILGLRTTAGGAEGSVIEQYLIKWKALSYIHCEWKDAAELALDSHNTRMKVRRCVRPSLQPAENSLTIAPSMARMVDRGFGHIGSAATPNGE